MPKDNGKMDLILYYTHTNTIFPAVEVSPVKYSWIAKNIEGFRT